MNEFVVICEPLTAEEEADFLLAIEAAVASGELRRDEADQLIDREILSDCEVVVCGAAHVTPLVLLL